MTFPFLVSYWGTHNTWRVGWVRESEADARGGAERQTYQVALHRDRYCETVTRGMHI